MIDIVAGLWSQYNALKKRFKSLDTSTADPAEIKDTIDALDALEERLIKETEKKKQRLERKEAPTEDDSKTLALEGATESSNTPAKKEIEVLRFLHSGKHYLVSLDKETLGHVIRSGPNNFVLPHDTWKILGVSKHHLSNLVTTPLLPNIDPTELDGGIVWDIDHGVVRKWGGSFGGKIPRLREPVRFRQSVLFSEKSNEIVSDLTYAVPKVPGKFEIDSCVCPIRGDKSSIGKVMRHDSPDSLVYVMWEEGPLKEAEQFGGYYPTDLQIRLDNEDAGVGGPCKGCATKLPLVYGPTFCKECVGKGADAAWLEGLSNKKSSKNDEVTEKNRMDYMIQFESGELSDEDTLALFQHLVDTGLAWSLQGSYGRMAKQFLDRGLITSPKDKEAEKSGVGYGGDRPGIAVEPKRDESVSLNSMEKDAVNVEVYKRTFEAIPHWKEGLTDFEGYEIHDDIGRKVMFINTKSPMTKEQLEFVIGKELSGPKVALLKTDLAFMKKGSLVKVVSYKSDKNRIRFASLDGELRGSTNADKVVLRKEAEHMRHNEHICDVLGYRGDISLVECPIGSGDIKWVSTRELMSVTPPPATPESLTDLEAEKSRVQCDLCKKDISTEPVRHESVRGGRKSFCSVACREEYTKALKNASLEVEGSSFEFEFVDAEGTPSRLDDLFKFLRSKFKNREQMEQQFELFLLEWANDNGYHLEFDGDVARFINKKVHLSPNWKPPVPSESNPAIAEGSNKRLKQIEWFKNRKKKSSKILSKKQASDDNNISLEQHIEIMRSRMDSVKQRLSKVAAKEVHPLETGAVEVLIEDLEMGVDLLENIYRDKPDVIDRLEELENVLTEVEHKLGLEHDLPSHEQAEPAHKEHVDSEKVEKESEVSVSSARPKPAQPPPQGYSWAYDSQKDSWDLVKTQP